MVEHDFWVETLFGEQLLWLHIPSQRCSGDLADRQFAQNLLSELLLILRIPWSVVAASFPILQSLQIFLQERNQSRPLPLQGQVKPGS